MESTDNAYVQGEITRVASQLGARVEESWCATTSTWTRGSYWYAWKTPTSSSPSRRAQAALATREAELAQARSKLVQQGSLIAASAADVNASQATLGRAQIDLNRAEALRKPGYVSEERVTTLTADNHVARSQLARPAPTSRHNASSATPWAPRSSAWKRRSPAPAPNWRKPKSTCHAP